MQNDGTRPADTESPPIPWFLRSRWRSIAVLSLILALGLATPAVVTSVQIPQSLHAQSVQQNRHVARLAARMVDAHLDGLRRYIESYGRRTLFLDAVASRDGDQTQRYLDELVRTNPHFGRAFVTDRHGVLWADYPVAEAVHGKSFATRDWFRGVSQRHTTYVSGIYRRAAPPPANVIAVAVPLRDGNDRLVGYLVGQHVVDTLVRWLSQLELAGDVRLALLDRYGVLAAAAVQEAPVSLANHPLVTRALAGAVDTEEAEDPITAKRMLISYAGVPSTGWTVLAREPLDAVYGPIAAFQRSVFGMTALFITTALALGWAAITVMQRSHRALADSEARFRALAETANDAIVLADSGGVIIYVNNAAEHIFGYPTPEAVGRPITLLMPERFHAQHIAGIERLAGGAAPRVIGKTVELTGRRRDGEEFPLEISLTSWTEGKQIYFAGTLRDITRRKQTEQQIAELNAGLERRATELEVLNRELEAFSYSVSHDLRAPLRAIDGFSQALLEDYGTQLDAGGKDFLMRVRGGAQRMGHLIDDLLKLSRVTRAELSEQDVDLSALANEIVADIDRQSPQRKVEFAVTPELKVHADSALMRILLENLLSNAWKFTGRTPHARVEFGASPVDGERVFYVRDNGAGFDMAYAQKLFGPFQRLHDAQEFPGTGIGLATVQRVVSKHGGRVWAEGAPGAGATFYFTVS